nr:uncharacterized protein LOC109154171 [Ipomoea batatas]
MEGEYLNHLSTSLIHAPTARVVRRENVTTHPSSPGGVPRGGGVRARGTRAGATAGARGDPRLSFIEWRKLWRLPIAPKVKNFLRRCMRYVLPVRELLKTRHVWAGGRCPFCATESETMEHLFCACPVTKQVWIDLSILFEESLPLLLNKLIGGGCLIKAVHVAAILWVIWCTRNYVVWKEASWSVIGMRRQLQVAGLHEVWHAAYSQPDHVHATVPSPAYWFPLAVNQLKCKVDAAIYENGASYGVVVRDHNGRFVDACVPFRDGVLCQFTGKNQSDGGLDLAGSNGRLLVVAGQSRRLLGELLEDIVDKLFMMPMALLEISISGWTCFRTLKM